MSFSKSKFNFFQEEKQNEHSNNLIDRIKKSKYYYAIHEFTERAKAGSDEIDALPPNSPKQTDMMNLYFSKAVASPRALGVVLVEISFSPKSLITNEKKEDIVVYHEGRFSLNFTDEKSQSHCLHFYVDPKATDVVTVITDGDFETLKQFYKLHHAVFTDLGIKQVDRAKVVAPKQG